MHGARGSHNQ
ncbi:hypothetical protein Zm00014a_041410 [Zea mays]|uniref:Uncharacterized protein n=1 Tax=Zea mays TaxID=4577 RepID=A0A3L6GAP6_MAIZE|nr:hypothetical protein Zm00014a_041410 [Zea mays]